jgi:hypothetical protein
MDPRLASCRAKLDRAFGRKCMDLAERRGEIIKRLEDALPLPMRSKMEKQGI